LFFHKKFSACHTEVGVVIVGKILQTLSLERLPT